MPTIHYVENFIHWLTHEGKLVELLTCGSQSIPVIAESLDEHNWPYYNYAFVSADQEPSSGVIKGKSIPDVELRNGHIQEQDKAIIADFVQGFGVNAEVASRILSDLEEPKSYCLCARSIREGTASVGSVTFSKNLHGDLVMWIRDTIETEPDDLVPIDWDEAKTHLPAIEHLEEELAYRPHAHLLYDIQADDWQA